MIAIRIVVMQSWLLENAPQTGKVTQNMIQTVSAKIVHNSFLWPPKCLDCGWCLWSDYGSYLTSAFQECGFSTQPTGTSCLEDKTSYLEAYGTVSQTVTSDNPKASSYASNNAKSIYSSKNDTITSTSSGNGSYSSGEVVRSITSSFSTFESTTSSNSFDSTAATRSDSYSDSSSTISNTFLSTDAGNSISLGFAPIFLAFISIVLL
ncbi:hypothetical protein HII13_004489 [Brettanomyces bruxellensis]|nr:hypothetical protein HII13_004489 [Brettanomyces bruxellensis]